jgi:chemotaxis protein CheD
MADMTQRTGQEAQEQTLTVRIAEMAVVRKAVGTHGGMERRDGPDRRAGADRRASGERGGERGADERRADPDRRDGADRRSGAPSVLKTTLGSCVGVIISDRVKGVHGLAHVMLPQRLGLDKATGKYADTAVPALVAEMEHAGSARPNMEAFLVGGASMFQSPETSVLPRIGEKNVETVLRVLRELGIPVVFQETGGTAGRTVTFDCADRIPRVKTLNGVSQA